MSLTSSVMTSLCRGNKGILTQKLGLLNILASQYNNKAQDRFQTICPIVGASIGQHFRHSMVSTKNHSLRKLSIHYSLILI